MSCFDEICEHLSGLTGRGTLAAGVACVEASGAARAFICGCDGPGGASVEDPSLRMRVASVTKMATAHGICALAADGVIDLEAACGMAPIAEVSLAELLSHTSGLTDHEGYLAARPEGVFELMARAVASGRGQRGRFEYCNLGYIAAALVVERQTGLRFDHLMSARVFQPAGITGGLNWIDTDASTRANRLAMYQRRGDGYDLEADGDVDPVAELVWTDGTTRDLSNYSVGRDTTLLSPHAGLRCNVIELARLAQWVGGPSRAAMLQRQRRWTYNGSNGEHCGGLFEAFGLGLSIYEDHEVIPGPLIGHGGNALGFLGGAWFNTQTQTAWGYVLTGAEDATKGQDQEAFYGADEQFIMERL